MTFTATSYFDVETKIPWVFSPKKTYVWLHGFTSMGLATLGIILETQRKGS
jgi:hypothetical protein